MMRVACACVLVVLARFAEASWEREYLPVPSGSVYLVWPAAAGGAVLMIGGDADPESVVVTNATGEIEVARTFEKKIHSLTAASNGAILVAAPGGEPGSFVLTSFDMRMVPSWSRRYTPEGGGEWDQPVLVVAGRDGGACAAISTDQRSLVARISAKGDVVWAAAFDVSGRESIHSMAATRDGGCVIVGASERTPALGRFDARGALRWYYQYAGRGAFNDVEEMSDGDLFVAGSFMMRTAPDGTKRWQREFPAFTGSSIAPDREGGVLVSGGDTSRVKLALVALDRSGAARWSKRFEPEYGNKAIDTGSPLAALRTGWLFAPFQLNGVRLYALDANGATTCGAFIDDGIRSNETSRAATKLPVEVARVRVDVSSAPPLAVRNAALTSRSAPCPVARGAAPADPPADSGERQDEAMMERVRELLRTRQYAELDALADRLRRERSFSDPLWWHLTRFYHAFNERRDVTADEHVQQVRDWVAARPPSVTARIALAHALRASAWQQRGGGFSSTVTDTGWQQYSARIREAKEVLAAAGRAAEDDPEYWTLQIAFAGETDDGDVREIVRRAPARHVYPYMFRNAANYLLPQWGGTPEEYVAFMSEAVNLTRAAYGDGLYLWLADYARAAGEEAFHKELKPRIDWKRVRKGFDDLVRLAPANLPTYHRYAYLAYKIGDHALARELFQRPELAWFPGAVGTWPREAYDRARAWALSDPNASATPHWTEQPLWPNITLENELVVSGLAFRRQVTFLVNTPAGALAVTAVPGGALQKWTMWWTPAPQKALAPQAFRVHRTTNGVIAIGSGFVESSLRDLRVNALESGAAVRAGEPVFVVGCELLEVQCMQKLFRTRVSVALSGTVQVELPDAANNVYVGAPVLDARGRAFAVVMRTEKKPDGKVVAHADELLRVLTTSTDALP